MREIKFRGYCKEHKMWVYGFLEDWMSAMSPSKPVIHSLSDWNLNSTFEVDKKSVGEFTGLKDKNGKYIYEGDLLIDTDPEPCRHRIVWLEDKAKFELETLLADGDWDSGLYDNLEYYPEGKENKLTEFEVIGNIYENHELLTFNHKE